MNSGIGGSKPLLSLKQRGKGYFKRHFFILAWRLGMVLKISRVNVIRREIMRTERKLSLFGGGTFQQKMNYCFH